MREALDQVYNVKMFLTKATYIGSFYVMNICILIQVF